MSMRSLCALSAVLLCFWAARPAQAQEVNHSHAVRLDSGFLCVLELLNYVSHMFETAPEQEARDLFMQAETLQRGGRLEEAYVKFQEVHLHCPTSRYGEKAMERINEIEVAYRNRNAPKPAFTILLGTVDDIY